ncbi:MAG: TauD/TfdA family dioxygenase [Alphaproteobacteria bacterium]
MLKRETNSGREPLTGPAVWTGAEIAAHDDWAWALTESELAELDVAVAAVRHLAWHEIEARDFPLPTLAPRLAEIADFLENGPGLAKITGLRLDGYSQANRRALYFGLCRHLGTPVSMSREGLIMSDVTDEGAAAPDRYGKVAEPDGKSFLSSRARVHSTGQLRWHNDRADVVALLCVAQACTGGESKLVSTPALHNAMLERCPDLLDELFGPIYRSRLGEEFGDNAAFYPIPVFALSDDGRFTCHYSRTFIEAAQKNADVPQMTARQWEALDAMVAIADELALETMQQPGEIQLLNNHVVFHARTAYQDHDDPARRRLLHRLWLSMPNSRPLPESFAVLFRDTAPGALRGGIPPAA